MLLAQNPKLMLVDEPVAGMTDVETETTAQVLREVNKSHSVVVVEHDMSFVRALGVKVTVLHEGSTLAEGIARPGQRRSARRRSLPGALTMLSAQNVNLYYGAAQALRGVSLTATIGGVTCLLGRNGVGKTSLLRAIVRHAVHRLGHHPVSTARKSRSWPPYERARRGVALVPQGREIFPLLTVKENLETGFAPVQPRAARRCRTRCSSSSRCCSRC